MHWQGEGFPQLGLLSLTTWELLWWQGGAMKWPGGQGKAMLPSYLCLHHCRLCKPQPALVTWASGGHGRLGSHHHTLACNSDPPWTTEQPTSEAGHRWLGSRHLRSTCSSCQPYAAGRLRAGLSIPFTCHLPTLIPHYWAGRTVELQWSWGEWELPS